MAKFLSQDQINEFKECFSLYDKKHKGKINASDLITVMRCLGSSPTPGEVARHLQLQKVDRTGEMDFSTFLTIMYRQMQQEDPKNEILLALLMADRKKTGFISVAELRAKLMNLGEKLSKEEAFCFSVKDLQSLMWLRPITSRTASPHVNQPGTCNRHLRPFSMDFHGRCRG
ncbi:calmodulin-like protein 4 isoform X1 [Podarcis muralis]|uniref:calmodulin-like protein 4 isoform X1 n=1 Tax=Podarcis muralis TaxID=64176 RepID=UPI0010A09CCD|nr:calmodulin-like protein 4 isoform X1 [Podarcis muralis]